MSAIALLARASEACPVRAMQPGSCRSFSVVYLHAQLSQHLPTIIAAPAYFPLSFWRPLIDVSTYMKGAKNRRGRQTFLYVSACLYMQRSWRAEGSQNTCRSGCWLTCMQLSVHFSVGSLATEASPDLGLKSFVQRPTACQP